MSKECFEFNRIEDALRSRSLSEADQKNWDAHRSQCESCRQQWRMHQQLLATVARFPPPKLSPRFDAALAARLEQQRALHPMTLPAKLGMGLYWAGTTIASLFILSSFDWPRPDFTGVWGNVLFLVLVPASYFLILSVNRVKNLARKVAAPFLA